MKKTYNFRFDPKTKPFPHQNEAIEYIGNKCNVALFDEQGLGKTKIVIDSLCKSFLKNEINGAVIICKKHLIHNWIDEIEMHSHLRYIVLRGSKNEKGTKYMGFSHFYIINYETVIGEVERLKSFLKIRNMAIILDESHKIKNYLAKSTKAIFELREYAKKRIILSGTPIANKPIDLWSQYYFLDGGILLGKNFNDFKKKYFLDLKENQLSDQQGRFEELRSIILANSIRRLKDNVLELPEKKYIDVSVNLIGKQLKLYEELKNKLKIEIENIDGDLITDYSEDILKKLLRLAQIASNPKLIDKSYQETPAKFIKLDNLINEILARNEKIIIWSCFVDNIIGLKNRYKKFGAVMIYGGIGIDERNEIVKKFKTNSEIKILVANPAAAKEGLTLTSANNAIYLDRNFNLVDYLQSQDRIHRISQTKICNIYKIIAKDTIDEYIDEIIYKKHNLAGFIQGDKEVVSDKQYLSKGELLNLLGGNK